MAGCLLIIGNISDVIGFKKIFLAGFTLFTIGSFTCGFLPDFTGEFPTLLASRVLQVLGSAMMTVIAPAMLSYYLPGDRRAKGMSLVQELFLYPLLSRFLASEGSSGVNCTIQTHCLTSGFSGANPLSCSISCLL